MKVIISSSSNILEFFQHGNDALVTTKQFPMHTTHFIPDEQVDSFIAKKLQLGFSCVILKPDTFTFNELVPKTIKFVDLNNN